MEQKIEEKKIDERGKSPTERSDVPAAVNVLPFIFWDTARRWQIMDFARTHLIKLLVLRCEDICAGWSQLVRGDPGAQKALFFLLLTLASFSTFTQKVVVIFYIVLSDAFDVL